MAHLYGGLSCRVSQISFRVWDLEEEEQPHSLFAPDEGDYRLCRCCLCGAVSIMEFGAKDNVQAMSIMQCSNVIV